MKRRITSVPRGKAMFTFIASVTLGETLTTFSQRTSEPWSKNGHGETVNRLPPRRVAQPELTLDSVSYTKDGTAERTPECRSQLHQCGSDA